jgi:hypothetical protein
VRRLPRRWRPPAGTRNRNARNVSMRDEQSEKLDEVTNDLDDLKTTVEELEESPPTGVSADKVKTLGDTLEKARDIADELEGNSAE